MYVCIVAKGDIPIYEAQLTDHTSKVQKDLIQFIIHAALDSVDTKVWTTTSMHIKEVNDKFSDLTVSGFVTAGHTRIMLLHDHKMDESAIRSFFYDVHELYIKAQLNPFYLKNTPILAPAFDERVRAVSKRYFR
jgi:hypothetical protein